MSKDISRRTFLKGAAALGAAAALNIGIKAQAEDAPPAEESAPEVPDWLGTAPGITDDMCAETMEADVVVIGAGVSGIAAARAASEAGASVIVLERMETITIRGQVFGCLDSKLHKELGAEYDKQEVVNEICVAQGNRVNGALWTKWANESGPAFDWFESIVDEEDTYFLEYWPNPEAYDNSTELRKQYCTGIEFTADGWIHANTRQYEKSVEQGAQYLFSTMAMELIKEDGVITGVYAQREDGSYIKVVAKNGVCLTTGDYSYDEAMVKALCPEFWLATGGKVGTVPTSIGYGSRMAIWAGAMMEPGPHAHMSHSFMGMMGVKNTATLNLNLKGKRYMNEDCDGQSFTNQVIRQPGHVGIQVWDNNWQDMLWHQGISHVAPYPPTTDFEAMQANFDKAVESPSAFLAGANTLEELFEIMGLPVETAVASVERYNELYHGGKDLDFGKRMDRMYPIETPPFYATRSITAACIVTAGIVVDENLRVLDENFDPIPHLWAAGNAAGGRYAAEYPVSPVVATSHGTAITFGRSIGTQAAAGDE